MIPMLIYNTKQKEINMLQKLSKDMIAFTEDESLHFMTFTQPKELVKEIKKLDLLDIAIIEVTNIEEAKLADVIRKRFPKVEIMLVSNATVSPMLYLNPNIKAASLAVRPLAEIQTKEIMRNFFQLSNRKIQKLNDDAVIWIEVQGEKLRVPYDKIIYFEAKNKRIYLRLQSVEYGMYGTMDKLLEKLPDQFIRCHRGFIVNKDYIHKVIFSENTIMLQEHMMIPLSRSYKTELKGMIKHGKSNDGEFLFETG